LLKRNGLPNSTLDGDITMSASKKVMNGKPPSKQTEDYLSV